MAAHLPEKIARETARSTLLKRSSSCGARVTSESHSSPTRFDGPLIHAVGVSVIETEMAATKKLSMQTQ